MSQENFDWRQHITDCMNSTQFMALGTYGADGPWTCPVYFVFDEQFKLYFVSERKSRHMKNIAENGRISAAIFRTDQEPREDVVGIQLEGKAKVIKNPIELAKTIKLYFAETPYRRCVKLSDIVFPKSLWMFVKVTPERMWLMDTKNFGEDRQEVPKNIF